MRRLSLILLLAVCSLSACARPTTSRPVVAPAAISVEEEAEKELVILQTRTLQNRLERVAFRVFTAAAPLCVSTSPSTGLHWLHRAMFRPEYRDAAVNALKLGDRPVVVNIVPNSPAAAAGFANGDVVVAIDGQDVPSGDQAIERIVALFRIAAGDQLPHDFVVERGGARLTLTMRAVLSCRYALYLVRADVPNAGADGARVLITTGMMRLVETDEELALVIGHELAHNIKGHVRAKQQNDALEKALLGPVGMAIWTGLTGGGGREMYSQAFELEADYVGLYLVARADYDIRGAAALMRAIAVNSPQWISHGDKHPPLAERFAALDATVAEIERKRAAGQSLLPEVSK